MLEQKIQEICHKLECIPFLTVDQREQLEAELSILKKQMDNVRKVLNAKKNN